MRTLNLYHLAICLRRSIHDLHWRGRRLWTLQDCLKRSGTRQKLDEWLTRIIDGINHAVTDTWKDSKKVDIKVERRLKHALYRLEALYDEIDAFEKDGKHPDSIMESFVRSTCDELELIIEELKPFSDYYRCWLVTLSVGCRGYELELEKLRELLLDPKAGTIVPILGKPGVGKSSLLGLALDDYRINNHFSDTKYIDYMSDQRFLSKTLDEILKAEYGIYGKKMLIALENFPNNKLMEFLVSEDQSSYIGLLTKRGGYGSKIVITSRLEPKEIGAHLSRQILSLSGLSSSESWNLFMRTAFPDRGKKRIKTLSVLGHQICEKCGNVPGVIMVIATILSFKKSPEEWKHFLDVVMTSVPDPITTVTYLFEWLQRSPFYRQIRSELGHEEELYCNFAWCSLLPQDYTFTKTDLQYLLKRQIYKDKRTLENWFDDLVSMGYFIECEGGCTIVSYKISSLGYELMKHVARDDYCLVDDPADEIHHKAIRHISFIVEASWEPPSWLPKADLLQSLWLWPRNSGDFIPLSKINSMLSGMGYLQLLHAEVAHCERIPHFLGEFKNLSYLRLGVVSTISLPDDIPILLKLLNCDPSYTSLTDDTRRVQALFDLLLTFTSKNLTIQPEKDNELDSTLDLIEEARHFMQSLNVQSIILSSFHETNEKLKSTNMHQTSESRLEVHCWAGEKWLVDDLTVLTYNLVSIEFRDCRNCHHFPSFSRLPRLSSLCIWGMCSLEEILIRDEIHEKSEASSTRTLYPSLKILKLLYLPKFKGWSHKGGDCFPLLAQVRIRGCPNLMSMPSVPMLKSLEAININAKLMKHLIYPYESSTLSAASSTPSPNYASSPGSTPSPDKEICRALSCLHSLKLDNIQLVSLPNYLESITTLEQLSLCWLTSLRALPEWITKLRRLTLHYCLKLRTLPNSYSGLEQLNIRYCPRLTHFPESLPNLKSLRVKEICRFEQILRASQNLEELEVDSCQDWEYDTQSTEGNSSVTVWKGHNKLRSLKLTKMEEFPKSIDFEQLSNLCHLTINSCPGLTQLPGALKNILSLKYLGIRMSPQLEKRCMEQGGEDWHRKIGLKFL